MEMSESDIKDLVQEVAFRCLEIGCKGKMLLQMALQHPFLTDAIRVQVMKCYRLDVGDLPPAEDTGACLMYEAPLCQDFAMPRITLTERLAELTQRSTSAVTVQASVPTDSSEPSGESREDRNMKKACGEDEDDDLVRNLRR